MKNIFLNDFIFPRLVEIKTDNFSLLGKFKKNFIHSAIRDSSADVAIWRINSSVAAIETP